MTLLGFERGDAVVVLAIRLRHELDRLVELARSHKHVDDPHVRDRLAWCYTKVEILRIQGQEALQGRLAGETPGSDAAMFKVSWSEYHRAATEVAVRIIEADALTPTGRGAIAVDGPDEPGAPNRSAAWVEMFLTARSGTIYAGASEIQQNVIAEWVLGLPREPDRATGVATAESGAAVRTLNRRQRVKNV